MTVISIKVLSEELDIPLQNVSIDLQYASSLAAVMAQLENQVVTAGEDPVFLPHDIVIDVCATVDGTFVVLEGPDQLVHNAILNVRARNPVLIQCSTPPPSIPTRRESSEATTTTKVESGEGDEAIRNHANEEKSTSMIPDPALCSVRREEDHHHNDVGHPHPQQSSHETHHHHDDAAHPHRSSGGNETKTPSFHKADSQDSLLMAAGPSSNRSAIAVPPSHNPSFASMPSDAAVCRSPPPSPQIPTHSFSHRPNLESLEAQTELTAWRSVAYELFAALASHTSPSSLTEPRAKEMIRQAFAAGGFEMGDPTVKATVEAVTKGLQKRTLAATSPAATAEQGQDELSGSNQPPPVVALRKRIVECELRIAELEQSAASSPTFVASPPRPSPKQSSSSSASFVKRHSASSPPHPDTAAAAAGAGSPINDKHAAVEFSLHRSEHHRPVSVRAYMNEIRASQEAEESARAVARPARPEPVAIAPEDEDHVEMSSPVKAVLASDVPTTATATATPPQPTMMQLAVPAAAGTAEGVGASDGNDCSQGVSVADPPLLVRSIVEDDSPKPSSLNGALPTTTTTPPSTVSVADDTANAQTDAPTTDPLSDSTHQHHAPQGDNHPSSAAAASSGHLSVIVTCFFNRYDEATRRTVKTGRAIALTTQSTGSYEDRSGPSDPAQVSLLAQLHRAVELAFRRPGLQVFARASDGSRFLLSHEEQLRTLLTNRMTEEHSSFRPVLQVCDPEEEGDPDIIEERYSIGGSPHRLFQSADRTPLKVTPPSSPPPAYGSSGSQQPSSTTGGRAARPSTAPLSRHRVNAMTVSPSTDVAQPFDYVAGYALNDEKLAAEFARVSQGDSVAPRAIVLQYLRHKYDSCGDINRFENLIKSLFPRRKMDSFDANEFAIVLLRLSQS